MPGEACPLDDIESEPERTMKRELRFEDDFSNEGLARYYTWVPGVGQASRTPAGLAYQIVRAWDGPASAEDLLTIDSLGRPQSPTTQVVFRFSGDEWTLEILVEYDFEPTRNGRQTRIGDALTHAVGEPVTYVQVSPEAKGHGDRLTSVF